jgi:hypothetical protein
MSHNGLALTPISNVISVAYGKLKGNIIAVLVINAM